MADKKAPADGWPVISGDYIVGDPESPVAVTTLASHIEAELSGAAIAGPCKTENLGIETLTKRKLLGQPVRFLLLKMFRSKVLKDSSSNWKLLI